VATQGPFYPGTVTTASVSTESANNWLTPGNISADDAAEAQITATTYDSPDISFRLIAANLGFSIPTDATINGITVEIDRRSIIASSGVDFRVQLQDASAALVGTNKASATIWPTSLTIATYGGAADTWSASPTPAMVNDPDFGVVLSVSANIANADIGVDFIRVTVTYTPSPNASVSASTVAGAATAPAVTTKATAITAVSVAACAATVPTPTVIAEGEAVPVGIDETGQRVFGSAPFWSEFGEMAVSGAAGIDWTGERVFGLLVGNVVATATTVDAAASVPTPTVLAAVEVDTEDIIAMVTIDQPAIQIVPSPQRARPDADQSIGTWTTDTGGTTNLWDALNEVAASDSDYVKSAVNPTNNEVIFTLTNIEDPLSSTGHEVRFRYRKTG
jgi:hypothetical protein